MEVNSFSSSGLPENWENSTLEKVADFINGDRGKNYPSSLDRVENGIPFINTGHIDPNGRLSDARMDFITRERFNLLGSGKVKPGDIVYCLRGSTIGKTARNHYEEGAIASSLAIVRAKPNADQAFLYYFLVSPKGQYLAKEHDNGSAQPNLSAKSLGQYPLRLPPLPEQKAIAHILGTLDDKIELNRQMNATLEAMAQALFQSWFVDFDPVIDNALAAGNPIPEPLQARAQARAALGDRRKPLPAAIQQQFPSRFVFNDDLGWVPEGWELVELGDAELGIDSGRRPQGGIDKELQEGIPSVGAESICAIGEFDYGKTKLVTKEFAQTVKKGWVKNLDVALYKDGGKPGLFKPRVSMYGNGFPYDTFMVNEHVFLLRSEKLGQPFLFYTVASQQFLEQLIAKGSAKAAQPGLNQTEVKDSCFLLPGQGAISAFNKELQAGLNKRFLLGKQSQQLAQLRDTLLPKLLSGQLRIPAAEKLIESVQ